MASSGVAFFGKPSFCLPTINNTGVCSKDSGFKIILENLRFLRLCSSSAYDLTHRSPGRIQLLRERLSEKCARDNPER